MTLVYQSPSIANAVLDAIGSSAGSATNAYRIVVAYATREGAKTLIESVSPHVGRGWDTIPKSIVTCFDYGITEPSALEYMQSNGFDVRIANLGTRSSIQLVPTISSFHPKLYAAPTSQSVKVIIGSANLSRRALTVNTEAVKSCQVTPTDFGTLWSRILSDSIELTPDLLESYRRIRPRQRSTPRRDEPPVPSTISPGDLPVYRDAIEAGLVNPTESLAFWVEVGSPSGGSGNQLELPRQAQLFFGYEFHDYDDEHHTIGTPFLLSSRGTHECPLTWHGNNRMERINLPTTAQSGLTYGNRVVLFERAGDGFKLTVDEPDGSRARRWRDEAAASGTLYRVSERSDRLCGLL